MNKFLGLLIYKIRTNLAAEGSRNYLSLLWWIFDPALSFAVYYLVFGVLINLRGENFASFLLVGIVPWQWFNRTVNNAADSLLNSGTIISYIRINKLFFPLVVIGSDLTKTICTFFVLILVLVFLGVAPGSAYAWLPLVIIVNLLFVCAVAIWVSLLIPFVPDLNFLVQSLLMALMFGSGVFFSVDIIPEIYHEYFYYNPMAALLTSYRNVMLDNSPPMLQQLWWIFVASCALLFLGNAWASKFDSLYIRKASN